MAHCWQPHASFAGSHWGQASQPCLPASTFRDLMYAVPKPRNPGRIMKPRSAGNSPSSAGRRRTAAYHSSPIYQQVPTQGYQAPFNAAFLASTIRKKRTARPISWHPAMLAPAEYSSPPHYIAPSTASDNLAAMNMHSHPLNTTAAPHEDVTMMPPYASSGLPASTDAYHFGCMSDPMSMQVPSYLQMDGSQVDSISWDAGASNVLALAQPIADTWAFDMMSMHNSIPSADAAGSSYASVPSSGCLSGPSTPDFLPNQQTENHSRLLSEPISDEQESGDELIGMGLYDHPEPYLDTSSQGRCGKGLKLEETFTPSANDEADDTKDAESEDDNLPSNEQVASDRFPRDSEVAYMPPKQSAKPASHLMQKSFFFEDEDVDQQPVGGYQQYFNLGTQPCLSYGYGWL
ncbi:hypothetical protein FE257_006371 [Aspergillus nanangensis]|uniref:Uncharacterized protein n=1 Tax=Aspergillus nanangensis TaxID=2582783 RepID=A0AAD4CXX1_ASPNN|nr:hypothetical protein FE257_006371 [Aspergillus nanangensis]